MELLKLRTDASLASAGNMTYLQVGNSVYSLSGASVAQQSHWWDLLLQGELTEDIIDEPEFIEFVNLLKSLRAFQEDDPWTTYGRDYGLQIKRLQRAMSDYPVAVVGDSDIVNNFISGNNWINVVGEDAAECVILLARSTQHGAFHEWNRKAFQMNKPTFMVGFDPFKAWLGPWIFPGETSCYNCATLRRQDNYTHPERRLFDSNKNEIRDNLPQQFLQATINVAIVSLTKHLMAEEGNAVFVQPIGNIVEYNWLAGTVETHKILRHPKCELCFPRSNKSTVWLPSIEIDKEDVR
ncbi:TOMM precursor leader peptide-binding protein [Alicyclobacillus sp. SO9]|uniref:TOMM precursor leader peptide-binding protein n=1 Tax=Alicyclobacillus sp. SO9 TaxID=2665646 RepID=UPI0018E70471|nr:TOMM precursor leader peptide-binding protein [Alicyclobacillus sp. SO9]QQE80164.1 TOMM precursor leader peptide-binding protein [Alicyclobacillus sp. SO9]